jgi:hypothetical protein
MNFRFSSPHGGGGQRPVPDQREEVPNQQAEVTRHPSAANSVLTGGNGGFRPFYLAAVAAEPEPEREPEGLF